LLLNTSKGGKKMNAIIAGIIGLIWVTIAVVLQIVSFMINDVIAAITFLILVGITPFILDKAAEML
jgi:hypothetical protein